MACDFSPVVMFILFNRRTRATINPHHPKHTQSQVGVSEKQILWVAIQSPSVGNTVKAQYNTIQYKNKYEYIYQYKYKYYVLWI